MRPNNFRQNWEWVHRMTVDFVNVVPEDRWEFTPAPRGQAGRYGFGPFCKQLRHVVCVRGVYSDAIVTKKADFTRSHDHYTGPLTRESLLAALIDKQQEFLSLLETFDREATIDFGGMAFTFDNFACELIQHESIHHGQWSVYAALGGFETPQSWRAAWKL